MPTTDVKVKNFVSYNAFMRAIFKGKVLRYKNAGITPPSFEAVSYTHLTLPTSDLV